MNVNTDDFMFAAKVGKMDPREKAQRKKTDEALLKKAKRFDDEMESLDDEGRKELKASKEWGKLSSPNLHPLLVILTSSSPHPHLILSPLRRGVATS